jgi:hypothetical protein
MPEKLVLCTTGAASLSRFKEAARYTPRRRLSSSSVIGTHASSSSSALASFRGVGWAEQRETHRNERS